MSRLNLKDLSYAVLSGPIFVPNVGQMGPTLVSGSKLTLTIEEPFVILDTQDKNGKPVSMPIPIAAFTHTVLSNK